MSDPAVEAARIAWRAELPLVPAEHFIGQTPPRNLTRAAREMAKPVRELIEEARTWKPYETRDIGDAYHAETVHDLLDDIAKLIYPSEELER